MQILTTANSWTVTVARWPESRSFQNELCEVMATRPHPTLTESWLDSITEARRTGKWVKIKPSQVFKRICSETKNTVVIDCLHWATLTSAMHCGAVTSIVRLKTCYMKTWLLRLTITIITQQKLQFQKHVGNKKASSQNTHIFILETPWS